MPIGKGQLQEDFESTRQRITDGHRLCYKKEINTAN